MIVTFNKIGKCEIFREKGSPAFIGVLDSLPIGNDVSCCRRIKT